MANLVYTDSQHYQDIADAIRNQNGSSTQYKPSEMAPAINALTISGGEEVTEPVPLDVDIIDYDGTLLYTYTAQDFLALESLPANPSHEGLIAQGWNWTLADAKTFVAEYGSLVIGQNYTTSDGKTHIYITIDDNDDVNLGSALVFYTSVKGGATIDWGDGSEPQVTTQNAGSVGYFGHYYAQKGDYEITIEVTNGTIQLGYNGSNQTLFTSTNTVAGVTSRESSITQSRRPRRIEVGNNVTHIYRQCFSGATKIESISIPTTVTSVGVDSQNGAFISCYSLKGVVIPSGITATGNANTCSNCRALKYFSVPKSVTQVVLNISQSNTLRKLTCANISLTSAYNLNECNNLTHFVMAGTYTIIYGYFARYCILLKKLVIPASVVDIRDYAFHGLSSIEEIHLRPTTPPALGNSRAFGAGNSNAVFYVPYSADHSILEAYQTATNWSTFASRMQEEPND